MSTYYVPVPLRQELAPECEIITLCLKECKDYETALK